MQPSVLFQISPWEDSSTLDFLLKVPYHIIMYKDSIFVYMFKMSGYDFILIVSFYFKSTVLPCKPYPLRKHTHCPGSFEGER